MTRTGAACWFILTLLGVSGPARGEEGQWSGEVRVRHATRLDWEFVVGAEADKLSRVYDSTRQRYQLFVPAGYKPDRLWPLIVFLSPGDDPLGWRAWKQPCEENNCLFCAPYGAGNSVPRVRRIRAVLDVLDDVRRSHRIDPDRVYLVGLGGGAPVVCSIAFALPEHFGGVVALGGGADPPALPWLRQRVRERLSVAVVAGDTDFARPQLENYFHPLLTDLGIRTRLWIVPRSGHGLPPDVLLEQVYLWLEKDRARRAEESRQLPGLAASPDEVATCRSLTNRALDLAATEWGRQPDKTFQAFSLLEWVTLRCDRSEGAERARKRMAEIQADPGQRDRLQQQSSAEERAWLAARARSLARVGEDRACLAAWEKLAGKYPASDEGKHAQVESRRLRERLARRPWLGAALETDVPVIREVVKPSPARVAGLQAGDRIVQLGNQKTLTPTDVRRYLQDREPGDKVEVTLERAGKQVRLTVQLGILGEEGGR
jgi:predicted esterase